MFTAVRFALPLSLCLAALIPSGLSAAQTSSLVPRTASTNLSNATAPYYPALIGGEDGLFIYGRKVNGCFVKDFPLTFLLDPYGVAGIDLTKHIINGKERGKPTIIHEGEALPSYTMIRAEERDNEAQHVQITARADKGNFSLTDCMLYCYKPATFDYTAEAKGERGEFEFNNRCSLDTIYCFINSVCIGKAGKRDTASCDLRHLPVGTYRFAAVGEAGGGFLPYKSFEFTIEPRYKIELPGTSKNATIVVSENEFDGGKLKIRATRSKDCTAPLAEVYADSTYVGEVTPEKPELDIPLKDIPPGDVVIEVVPLGADEVEYPEETITVKLENERWKRKIAQNPNYRKTKENAILIKDAEEQAAYWMGKASEELPYTLRREIRDGSDITTMIPGKAGLYVGNARREYAKAAELCYQNGHILRILRVNGDAKRYFKKAMEHYGSNSAAVKRVKAEMDEMLRPKRLKQDKDKDDKAKKDEEKKP